jgi:hypothetical protein
LQGGDRMLLHFASSSAAPASAPHSPLPLWAFNSSLESDSHFNALFAFLLSCSSRLDQYSTQSSFGRSVLPLSQKDRSAVADREVQTLCSDAYLIRGPRPRVRRTGHDVDVREVDEDSQDPASDADAGGLYAAKCAARRQLPVEAREG